MIIKTLIFLLGLSLLIQAQDVTLQWQYFDLGSDIGERGVIVGDFDGNGYQEMFVVANSDRDIMKIQFDGQNYTVEAKLERPHVGSNEELGIHSMVHLQTDADYALVTTVDGDYIFIYDLTTMELVEYNDMEGAEYSYFAGIADLPDAGAVYTFASSGQVVVVYGTKEEGFYKKTYSGMPEFNGIMGSFTGAGLNEIAYSDGSIYQYNSESDTFSPVDGYPFTLTSYSNTLMIKIDIDGDGVDEIVANSGVGLECSSALDFSIIWTWHVKYLVMGLIAGDYDSDGDLDIIYGDDQWGEIHGINAPTGTELGRIDNPEHGVVGLSIGDYDNDGVNEVSWCGGATSSSGDWWFIADPRTGTEEWMSEDLDGPYTMYAFNNFDSVPGYFFASHESENGYEGSVMNYYDLESKSKIWSQVVGSSFGGANSVDIANNLFGDGDAVIVVGEDSYLHYFSARDGSEYEEIVTQVPEYNVKAVFAGVFSDDSNDIVAYDSAIHIIQDGDFENIFTTSPDLGSSLLDIAVANLDGGAERDVYALDNINEVWRFDLESGHMVYEEVVGFPSCLAATQKTDFGFSDAVYYGTKDGLIRKLGDSSFEAQVCFSGEVVRLRSLSSFSLTFVCADTFGAYDIPSAAIAFTHNLDGQSSSQGDLVGASIDGTNYYIYGDSESVGLYV